MSGAIPPLPNTPSWRGARLSAGTTLPFTSVTQSMSVTKPGSRSVSKFLS